MHTRIDVDQLLVGGLYDLSPGRIRPFLAGGVGLTRFSTSDGSTATQFEFTAGLVVGF